MLKYFLAWLGMIPLAIANGVLRQAWYGQYLDELAAHQVSTFTAMLLFGIYISAVMRWSPPRSNAQAVSIGLMWFGFTVLFEFLLGRYIAGHSWRALVQDYNLFAGRVWLLALLFIAAAPYVFHRLENASDSAGARPK